MTWAEWLESSKVAISMRQMPFLYPMVEIIHIMGVVMLVGGAFLFDLRLLGVNQKIRVEYLANYLLPWSRRGLWLVIPSGLLLFISQADAIIRNPVFQLKLALIFLAFANAFIFDRYFYRRFVGEWEGNKVSARVKGVAIVSLVLWMCVISCGRLIAYF